MTALPEDCPCCDSDAAALDASMVQAFVSGFIAGRQNLKVSDALCERHLRLTQDVMAFVSGILLGGKP